MSEILLPGVLTALELGSAGALKVPPTSGPGRRSNSGRSPRDTSTQGSKLLMVERATAVFRYSNICFVRIRRGGTTARAIGDALVSQGCGRRLRGWYVPPVRHLCDS